MEKPIRAILFGAGNRGAEAYGPYALENPTEIQFVAVADPDEGRRTRFATQHQIPPAGQFASWEEVTAQEKFADVVVNCTQDQTHFASSEAALQRGYDMLLEKPITNTLGETVKLWKLAGKQGLQLQICHVLRFTGFFQKIHEIVHAGRLGQIITVSHRENVSAWHMAHSFVRGNWRREDQSAPMILAKSCHDLDLLYWIVGQRAKSISSVGNLRHYRPEYAPVGAPERCTDGCPVSGSCPYYAPAIYLDLEPYRVAYSQSSKLFNRSLGRLSLDHPELVDRLGQVIPQLRELSEYTGWPRSVLTDHTADKRALLEALQHGPYGRCVYHCDNDVVDHQVVQMQFEDGVSASFTMHGHSHEEGRTIRIDGSKATMLASFGFFKTYIELWDHRQPRLQKIDYSSGVENRGHGGGDFGIMREFVQVMRGQKKPLASTRDSVESHLMAFAAEQARKEQIVIDMAAFRQQAGVID